MRKPLIAGNWKMNMTMEEALAFAAHLQKHGITPEVDTLICAPATLLFPLCKVLEALSAEVGAQNVYFEECGAFTGEISATMVKDAGATAVILGHSERRQLFGESNLWSIKKWSKPSPRGSLPSYAAAKPLKKNARKSPWTGSKNRWSPDSWEWPKPPFLKW